MADTHDTTSDTTSGFVTRFEDGPTASVACVIAATPTDVWTVISDPGFPARHSDELYRAEWADPTVDPDVGSRIHGWNRGANNEWDTYSTVTVWDPPRRFEWTVDPIKPEVGAVATWWFELEAIDTDAGDNGAGDNDETTQRGDGAVPATRLVQGVRLGPGPSYLTMAIAQWPDKEARIIASRLGQQRAAMQANLDAIAEAVTGYAGPAN